MAARKTTNQQEGVEKKRPVSLLLEPALHDRMRKLAFDRRLPMTELMVRGIEMVLKAEKY